MEIDNNERQFIFWSTLASSTFSYCVDIVVNAYKANGLEELVQRCLDLSKEQILLLSENYPDYEHYPALKGFFTTTSAFSDYCQNPYGSFQEMTTTIQQYKNDCRKYYNELKVFFED